MVIRHLVKCGFKMMSFHLLYCLREPFSPMQTIDFTELGLAAPLSKNWQALTELLTSVKCNLPHLIETKII